MGYWQEKEKKQRYDKEYYLENKEKILERKHKYYLGHKERQNERCKQYYLDNKEKFKEWHKQNYLENRKERGVRGKQYFQKNKESTNECRRKHYKTDISFRILSNLRSRIRGALHGYNKSVKTIELIGCTISELKAHLQKQFQVGMSWDNYGKWHVDHKTPCTLFDLIKPGEQKVCFNYMNLQPLWAADNIRKSNRVV